MNSNPGSSAEVIPSLCRPGPADTACLPRPLPPSFCLSVSVPTSELQAEEKLKSWQGNDTPFTGGENDLHLREREVPSVVWGRTRFSPADREKEARKATGVAPPQEKQI